MMPGQTDVLDSQVERWRERSHDLKARTLLHGLAHQVILDAEAFRYLIHASLYLADRNAYEADRMGALLDEESRLG